MQTSDERTTTEEPRDKCDATAADAGDAVHSSQASMPALKRSGRGMSMRRRIGLKIEADENGGHRGDAADDHGTGKDSEGRDANGTEDGERADADGGEWWKNEYKAPPPGHLGAHAVPVPVTIAASARDDGLQLGLRARSHSVESTEHKLGRMEVTGTEISLSHSPHQPMIPQNTHDTPERASRKVRGGSELHDASTSHSSPNQKRKIIDLQDCETGTFPSMGVAKELKRFHESNGGQYTLQHHDGESEISKTLRTAVVTPSKLLRPMKKIDLEADSTACRSPRTKGKASESA